MSKVSIIIPIFNEEKLIGKLLNKLKKIKLINNLKKEIICINDGSTDNTLNVLKKFKFIKIINQKNFGKGFAVQQGIRQASGKYIVIQDADLEYHPDDINKLLKKIISKTKAVVYGSRYKKIKILSKIFTKNQSLSALIFNYILSFLFYVKKKIYISDLLTGYKVYHKKFFNFNKIISKGFEADHEITIKLLKAGYKIEEIPIKYSPRSKKEGKKINFKDAIKAIFVIYKLK